MTDTREMYLEMEQMGFDAIHDFTLRGQQNYGDAFLELGAKGQFSEIWRKVKKLQRAIWEGEDLIGEQPEQIAAEIIPHLLMLMFCLKMTPEDPKPFGVASEDIKNGDLLEIDFSNGTVRRHRG